MSGETPRTDRAVAFDNDGEMVTASFARTLERELAEMKEFRESETRWAAQYKRERDKAEQSAAKISVELGRALSERDGLKYQLKSGEETAARMLEVTIKERDEARQALSRCSLNCEHLSHRKNELHEHDEKCPVEVMVRKAAGVEEQ
jgi:hypothetical protein